MTRLSAVLPGWRAQRVPRDDGEVDRMFQRVSGDDATTAFERDLRGWALGTGLYSADQAQELADARLGELTCYVTPGARGEVRWPIGMYNARITRWDDEVVERGDAVTPLASVVDRLLRDDGPAPDGGQVSGGQPPVVRAALLRCLGELREHLAALGGRPLRHAVADEMARQFEAWRREQGWMAEGRLPSLEEYLPHHGCTMTTYAIMLMYCGPVFSPLVEHVARGTCVVLGVQNDLSGFWTDLERDYPLNAVTVIAAEYDLDLVTAYRCALAVLAAQWYGMRRLVNDVCEGPDIDPAEASQARAILAFVDGFHTWNTTSPRQNPGLSPQAPG